MNNFEKEWNLKLWKEVCITNPDWVKNERLGGRKVSSVNPQKQIKRATELWGPYGYEWGLTDCNRQIIDLEEKQKLLILEAFFFYPVQTSYDDSKSSRIVKFQISNSIKLSYYSAKNMYMVDNEAFKKVETNTISKALSKLGFSSDIYEGRFENTSYKEMAGFVTSGELPEATIRAGKIAIKEQDSVLSLTKFWAETKSFHANQELKDFYEKTMSFLKKANK